MTTDPITSSRNQRLRELKRLQQRKYRREQGLFVTEGEDLVAEALRHGTVPQTVFSVKGAGPPRPGPPPRSRTAPARAGICAAAGA